MNHLALSEVAGRKNKKQWHLERSAVGKLVSLMRQYTQVGRLVLILADFPVFAPSVRTGLYNSCDASREEFLENLV